MEEKNRKGVLLVNLGSPDSTKVSDVRKYLREFLMDKRVIDVSYLFRYFLVNFIIVPFRAKKSSKAYRKIWWSEGSPLKVISERLTEKVQNKVDIPVALAMRYAQPDIQSVMTEMYNQGIRQLHIFPLYPQYAMSTTETVVEKCKQVQQEHFKDLHLTFEPSFYNDPEYIQCLVHSLEDNVRKEVDAVLFSYHGIPERHIYKTDKTDNCKIGSCCFESDSPSHKTCYRHQCYETTRLTRKAMGLPQSKVYQSFQSRLGKDPWLQPYTSETLENMPKKGKKKIAVLAPAFVSDCLETLEELNMEGRNEFIDKGGQEFIYVPCVNDNEDWVNFIVGRILLQQNKK